MWWGWRFCFFFFQAEDGIRDHCVTGVQTCALPICWRTRSSAAIRCGSHCCRPLRAFEGLWSFAPVGSNGCRIELQLSFEFSNPLKAALLDGLLESTAASIDRKSVV